MFEEDDEDIVIVKVDKPKVAKKMTSWVSSSFDGFASGFSQPSKTPMRASLSQKISGSCSKPSVKDVSLSQTLLPSSTTNDSSRKRARKQLESNLPVVSNKNLTLNLWTEVYRPCSRADLAVHKKKVEEIYDWLTNKLSFKKHDAPILVLSGPPGAGKTACVNVLCKEIGVSIQHWENTSSLPTGEDFNNNAPRPQQERSKVDVYTSQSQATQFTNFLFRANKYTPLASLGSQSTQGDVDTNSSNRAVILVEELPNIFHRDTAQLHTILRKYHNIGQRPFIFIMTETNTLEGSLQKLFPKDLQNELHITNINVNPVAPTMMTKCLNRVISLSSGQKNFFAPSQSVLEMITQGSAGDLRAAFNMLQFACSKKQSVNLNELKESGARIQKKGSVSSSRHKNQRSKGKWSSSKSDESQSIVGVKDTSVFLFHAVGKILYFKRGDPAYFPDHQKLPPHLSCHDRDPLLLDPEEVVSKVHISPDFFTSFLHENYVNFVTSVEDLERISEYFSHADNISAIWTGRQELENYSTSLTTRGFIHSNSAMSRHDSLRKNQGWRPLHKSQWYSTVKQTTQNILSAKQLFRGCHWEPEVLCTELIPFIHFTNPTLHDPGQISFVHQMTQFSGRNNAFRSRMEQLNEKEAVEDNKEEEEELSRDASTITTDASFSLNQGDATEVAKVMQEVDEAEWGSDWVADDEDLLGSQNKVNLGTEEDQVDFVIDEFDD